MYYNNNYYMLIVWYTLFILNNYYYIIHNNSVNIGSITVVLFLATMVSKEFFHVGWPTLYTLDYCRAMLTACLPILISENYPNSLLQGFLFTIQW